MSFSAAPRNAALQTPTGPRRHPLEVVQQWHPARAPIPVVCCMIRYTAAPQGCVDGKQWKPTNPDQDPNQKDPFKHAFHPPGARKTFTSCWLKTVRGKWPRCMCTHAGHVHSRRRRPGCIPACTPTQRWGHCCMQCGRWAHNVRCASRAYLAPLARCREDAATKSCRDVVRRYCRANSAASA